MIIKEEKLKIDKTLGTRVDRKNDHKENEIGDRKVDRQVVKKGKD